MSPEIDVEVIDERYRNRNAAYVDRELAIDRHPGYGDLVDHPSPS